MAAKPSLASTTARDRTATRSPFCSTSTPVTRSPSSRSPVPGVLSTNAISSVAAIAFRSVRTSAMPPERAGSVCSRGALIP